MSKTFSEWYDFFMKPLEQGKFKRVRSDLLKESNGKVLELGSGTGINFPFYHGVEVTAIEPSEYMLNRSLKRREQAKVPIELVQSGAELLPFGDNSFDTVVATLVFCTIPDVDQAMGEMKRVCKPDGKILMFEHVKMDQPFLAKLQERLTPYWKKVCDGCCLNRETDLLVKKYGFKIIETREFYRGLFVTMVLNNEK
ncbi:Methyltransferase domain-containing protein [Mesobacillus persicus]|uniref:Methyltransferase domain-containing protein n=1 Tax=Mesobacillus persicus TaxID=930146 RepID=A0A1H7VY63_9BACI|nr:class I SAM-dependent methyltransferase [Mesobacillus persicus]SEM14206.1 Methyltransferase domain-containing protein [Mesobacillus persicus]